MVVQQYINLSIIWVSCFVFSFNFVSFRFVLFRVYLFYFGWLICVFFFFNFLLSVFAIFMYSFTRIFCMRFVQYRLTLCSRSHSFRIKMYSNIFLQLVWESLLKSFEVNMKHNFIPGILGMCTANTNPKHNVQMVSRMERKRDKNEIKRMTKWKDERNEEKLRTNAKRKYMWHSHRFISIQMQLAVTAAKTEIHCHSPWSNFGCW